MKSIIKEPTMNNIQWDRQAALTIAHMITDNACVEDAVAHIEGKSSRNFVAVCKRVYKILDDIRNPTTGGIFDVADVN